MEERTPVNTSDFLEERIKTRPRNRKRIIRRAIEVAIFAVLFGLIACVTMVFLSPILEEKLFPTPTTTNEVRFPEEIPQHTSKEVLPEDMLLEDKEDVQTEVIVEEIDLEERLREMIYFLRETSETGKRWMVQVNGVSNSISWLESTNIHSNKAAGAIIADNEVEWLILVDRDCLQGADKIEVTFVDGYTTEGYPKGDDADSGLAIVAVGKENIPIETIKKCAIVEMASSNNRLLVGNAVMAMGNLAGANNMTTYGFVTARGIEVNSWDVNYRLIMTDMYASRNPNGFLVNLNGQLVGVLCNDYNSEDTANMTTALGISELKKKIEHMSNETPIAFLGVRGTDVTDEAQNQLDIPQGAYVLNVKIDSPAMRAGIQAGDIIVRMNGKDISSMNTLSYYLYQSKVGEAIDVVIMRQSQGTYKESTLNIVLGNSN